MLFVVQYGLIYSLARQYRPPELNEVNIVSKSKKPVDTFEADVVAAKSTALNYSGKVGEAKMARVEFVASLVKIHPKWDEVPTFDPVKELERSKVGKGKHSAVAIAINAVRVYLQGLEVARGEKNPNSAWDEAKR